MFLKLFLRFVLLCDVVLFLGLIVYDLDDMIWFFELYMIVGVLFVKMLKFIVVDSGGVCLGCYLVVFVFVVFVKLCGVFCEWGMLIVVVLWMYRGKWVCEFMDVFEVCDGDDDVCMFVACVDFVDIVSGFKMKYFVCLCEKFGVFYVEMLFFDNECENIDEVVCFGVVCVYCFGGLFADVWRRGLIFFVDDVVDL